MSYVTPPRKVRASSPRRISDSFDARPAGSRSSTRSYSGRQFANDVYGTTRSSRPPATKVIKITAPTGTYKPRLRGGI